MAADARLPAALTPAERQQALAALRWADSTFEAMADWLAEHGEGRAAALVDEAWRAATAAGWVILRNGGLEPGRASPNGLTRQF